MADGSNIALDNARLAQVNAAGVGKSTEDAAGKDNAHVEHLSAAANAAAQALKFAIPIPGAGVLSAVGTVSMAAGLESEGLASKNIMPTASLSGSDTFIGKLIRLLMKGGFQIKDMAEYVTGGALIEGLPIGGGESVSMASLGTFTPDFTPTMGTGRDSGISYGGLS